MKIFRIYHPGTGEALSPLWFRNDEQARAAAAQFQKELQLDVIPEVKFTSGHIMLYDPLQERVVWLKGDVMGAAAEVPGLEAFDPADWKEIQKEENGHYPLGWSVLYTTLKRWEEVGGYS